MNDNSSQLQIRQLSARGELLRAVNCFAGQVTVLRAHVDQDLMPFQRALAGRPGPERFSILLNHEPFSPEANVLIGYGEQLPRESTVWDFCIKAGIPEGSLSALFVSYGLDGSESKLCSDLSECAARRIQILTATFSPAKVWILNNPFDPISSGWRERFAELILNDTRLKQRIVVVAGLSYRPQAWVGNELINRVQVGESVQKTVGFGSQANDVNDMVKQLRDILKSEDAVQTFLQSQGRTASGAIAAKPEPAPNVQSTPEPIGVTASSAIGRPESGAYSGAIAKPQPNSPTAKLQDWESSEPNSSKPIVKTRGKPDLTAITNKLAKSRLSPKHLALLGFSTVLLVGLGGYIFASRGPGLTSEKTVEIANAEKDQPIVEQAAKTSTEAIETDPAESVVKTVTETSKPEKSKPIEIAKLPSHDGTPPIIDTSNNGTPSGTTTDEAAEHPAEEPITLPAIENVQPLEMAKATFVLDNYPSEIKQAVLKAFSVHANSASANLAEKKEVSPKLPSFQTSSSDQKNPFAELKGMNFPESSHDSSAPPQPNYPQQNYAANDGSQESMEERQARVRQKFMEAINRAIEKREQSGGGED